MWWVLRRRLSAGDQNMSCVLTICKGCSFTIIFEMLLLFSVLFWWFYWIVLVFFLFCYYRVILCWLWYPFVLLYCCILLFWGLFLLSVLFCYFIFLLRSFCSVLISHILFNSLYFFTISLVLLLCYYFIGYNTLISNYHYITLPLSYSILFILFHYTAIIQFPPFYSLSYIIIYSQPKIYIT